MKYYLLAILFFTSLSMNAQEVQIKQENVNYESSDFPAFSIYLKPGTKEVKKQLKDFMDDEYDTRLKGIGFLTTK